MNRDGYRGGRDVAEHEGAHAVIGLAVGLTVGFVSIAPSLAQRRRWLGQVEWAAPHHTAQVQDGPCGPSDPHPCESCVQAAVAGYVWETEVLGHDERFAAGHADGDLRGWLNHTDGAMTVLDAVDLWDRATDWVADQFERPNVQAAIRHIADRLQGGRSGEIYGTTVDRICAEHALTPGCLVSA